MRKDNAIYEQDASKRTPLDIGRAIKRIGELQEELDSIKNGLEEQIYLNSKSEFASKLSGLKNGNSYFVYFNSSLTQELYGQNYASKGTVSCIGDGDAFDFAMRTGSSGEPYNFRYTLSTNTFSGISYVRAKALSPMNMSSGYIPYVNSDGILVNSSFTNSSLYDYVARPTSYYVNASTGNDNNSGTEASPFKTIQKAITKTNANSLTTNCNIYVAGGTYPENITVSGRNIILYLDGNVTIGKAGGNAITSSLFGRLTIRGARTSTATFNNLTITNGTQGLLASAHAYLLIQWVGTIYFGALTSYPITSSGLSFLEISTTTNIQIQSTFTSADRILNVGGMSYMNVNITGAFTSSSTTQRNYFANVYGRSYLYLAKTTISNKFTTGLYSLQGAIIVRSSVTNNATTPTATSTGGTIV